MKRLLPHIPLYRYSIGQRVLTENDILDFHNILLTPGVHYLEVNSFAQIRALLYSFLDSLGYYQAVGCFTQCTTALRSDIVNIYEEMLLAGALEYSAEELRQQYLQDQFFYDFIWIEVTPELNESLSLYVIESALRQLVFSNNYPLLYISLVA